MVIQGIHHLTTAIPYNMEENKNQIWYINYKQEFQGLVVTDSEIESHYYDIHTALVQTFLNGSYSIIILEGYMVAVMKQNEFFY